MCAAHRRREAGFSLLELIVVMSIMAVLAGVAIPVVSKSITRSRITDTRGRLARLESAISAYFEDTERFPPSFEDLESNVSGVDGWVGPYLRALTAGAVGTNTGLSKDAWGREYTIVPEGMSALRVISAGPDGIVQSDTHGSGVGGGKGKGKGGGKGKDDGGGDAGVAGDDLVLVIDVTPIRRAATLSELDVLDAAVTGYNATHLPDEPLPSKFSKLLKELSKQGYLPKEVKPWKQDAWGDEYETDPKDSSPPMGVSSVHIDA